MRSRAVEAITDAVPMAEGNDAVEMDNDNNRDGDGTQNQTWKVTQAGELEVLSTRESVLRRPDMWIGDISTVIKPAYEVIMAPENEDMTNIDDDQENGTVNNLSAERNGTTGMKLVARQREMKYNAGVLKTFDEIIVNAVDRQVEVEEMREIRVTINRSTGELSVWNDGPGIDPAPHKSGKGLVPEVAFGEFMASTNFDDTTRKRFTGGRFGVGAKATNAWSKRFCVQTCHASTGKHYLQTWYDNMERKDPPNVVKNAPSKSGWTQITWTPDYPRFGMQDGLDDDTYACMTMRVYDLCACTREQIRVTLNGVALPFRSLSQYASLFWGDPTSGGRPRVSVSLRDASTSAKLDFLMSVSTSAHLEARGIVNGVLCSQGTHIDHIVNRVSDGLVERALRQLKKEKMQADVSKAGLTKMRTYFRQHIAIIVVALLPNPRFDGQTKERLTLHPKDWGFVADIDDKMVERIDKGLGLVEKVLMEAEARNMAALHKKSGTPAGSSARVSIAKYQGANFAGKAGRPTCYLLATEGDSAKDLAVAGMEIVGRDCYGVIPLRGVIRNVRPAKVNAKVLKDFLKNAELAAINKVLGLQFGQVYTPENVGRLLRYDHFVIFCDQDPVCARHKRALPLRGRYPRTCN
jgi:DNA topoisomerase-2